jgi:segregation and condensation protein A
VFEGPLDLLLYLIKRDELDIYDIPIERITQQYMQYLDVMKMLDLSIAGEFLVMAATLMMIKSRMLLPVEDRPELEAEEDDPRWDLVRQLVEYKKFKDAADHLEDLALRREDVFIREGDHVELGPDSEWRCTMSASLT